MPRAQTRQSHSLPLPPRVHGALFCLPLADPSLIPGPCSDPYSSPPFHHPAAAARASHHGGRRCCHWHVLSHSQLLRALSPAHARVHGEQAADSEQLGAELAL
eukprot:780632-Rhodomonas_salina.1